MKAKLLKLKLKNFKGITKTLNFQASNNIYGDNATGKTSLIDAHYWLYTGKSADYSTKMEVKPLKENGECEHDLITKVTEVLGIDGEKVELAKSWEEKWKTRGGEKEKLKGHESTYYINGVEKQKGEFEEYVSENIINIDLLPILTDPLKFNSLHWQDMRQRLLELEEVTNQDVLQEKDYDIADKIKKHGKDYKSKLKSEIKNIDNQREDLPNRIDELNDNLKAEPEHNEEWYQDKIEEIEQEIANLKSSDDNPKLKELQTKLSNLKTERLKVKSDIQDEISEEKQKYRNKIEDLQKEKSEMNSELNSINNEIENLETNISNGENKIEELRDKFSEVKEEEPKEQFVCPHCGETVYDYELDEDTEDFYEERSKRLEEINQKGKEAKEQIKKDRKELDELHDKRDETIMSIDALEEKISNMQKEKSNIDGVEDYKKFRDISAKIQGAKVDIQKEKRKFEDESQQENIQELKQEKQMYQQKIEDIHFNQDLQKKIEEHKQTLQEINQKYDEKQKHLNEMEQFLRDKAMMLQRKVNNRFDIVQFKLFEEKLNGSIKDTCIATVNGVPFEENLNTGNKINAGLDIIDKFQEYYNCRLPIFVDNSESVTDIYDINTQTIKLIKPEIDSEEKKEYYSELKQRKFSK